MSFLKPISNSASMPTATFVSAIIDIEMHVSFFSNAVGAVKVTSPTLLVAPGVAIMAAQTSSRIVAVAALSSSDIIYVFMIIYYTENYCRVLHAYQRTIHAWPALTGQFLVRYWSEAVSIRQVQDLYWCIAACPPGMKNQTLVVYLGRLLVDGICASGKLAVADISTWSTSTECRLCRHWWHRRLP